METENNKKKKKYNRPASIAPRDKQKYAQYVWIRQIYLEIDAIKARLDDLEKSAKFIKDESNQSNKAKKNGKR